MSSPYIHHVSAWRSTPAAHPSLKRFGLRLTRKLRDAWLHSDTKEVHLSLEGMTNNLTVMLSNSFWKKCPEFRHPIIGEWILSQGLKIPWPKGEPYHFEIELQDDKLFHVKHLK